METIKTRITIQEVKKAREEIKRLDVKETEEIEKIWEEKEEEIRELKKKEREIKDLIWDKKVEYEQKEEAITKDYKLKYQETLKPINEFKRIMAYFKVLNSDKSLNYEVYNYDYPRDEKGEVIRTKNGSYPERIKIPLERLKVLANDEFKHIAFYLIYDDSYRKKVNKYSLCIIGKTIFSGDVFKDVRPYNYVLPCNTNYNNIAIEVKVGKTREELIRYCDRYKGFNGNLAELEKLEKEYLEAIKLWDLKEWKIAYLEDRKDYYKNNYSHGTETEEYKIICEEIVKLNEVKRK